MAYGNDVFISYSHEDAMDLPNAIRKMTSFPAQRLGLPDRGILRDGFKADIVVFDAKRVKAPATRTQPKQFPIGIEYVMVNGKVVVDEGRHTGVMAGRRPAPRTCVDVTGPAAAERPRPISD
jgi:N-acyl-D-aspartate/D-glutamate deacylase